MVPSNESHLVEESAEQGLYTLKTPASLVAVLRPDNADAHAMELVNQKITRNIVTTKSYK